MDTAEIVKRNDELFVELKKYPEDAKEYRDIASEIIKNNEPLVTSTVKQYFPIMKKFTLDRDDLISEGLLGVLRAIKSFDPSKGAFSTYAVHCIRSRISTRFRDEKKYQMPSLQDNKINHEDGRQQKLEDVVAAPVNLEKDFIEKDEKDQQLTWVRENLDRITPFQRKVLTLRYLSGGASLKRGALAKKLDRLPGCISDATHNGIAKLKKIYYESSPESIAMTRTDKIALKGVLKDLILTELPSQQQEVMLCRYYSATTKTNEQVAQEIGSTKNNVVQSVYKATQKLCVLCDSIKDKKHLKNILEFGLEKS